MSKFIFTPYLGTLLSGLSCPKAGTKDFTVKTTLNGLVNEAWRDGKFFFTEDEIEEMVSKANDAAGQDPGLVSLKMSYARNEKWFVEVA